MSTVKRLFLYIVSLTGLILLAWGTGTLLSLVLDLPFGGQSSNSVQYDLSLGLAMLVIGGVVWFLFWRLVQRAASADTLETGSGIRKLYMNLVLLVSAMTFLSNLPIFFAWLIGGSPYPDVPSGSLSAAIVTAVVWWYHNRIESGEGQPSASGKTLRRWYLYILTAFTLISVVTSFIQVLHGTSQYLFIWNDGGIRDGLWRGLLAPKISVILFLAFAWWHVWFRQAKDDIQSVLRQVYLYLLTIAGAAVTFLVGVTTTFYNVVKYLLDSSADVDFSMLGWTLPAMLISVGVWTYHRKIVDEEAVQSMPDRFSPRRLYLYLMSFIGLGTLAAGVISLFSVLLNLIFDSASSVTIYTAGWWSGQLALALSLLITGVPLWLYCWMNVMRMTDGGGVEERSALSRRIFLYAVLGISLIAAVATLVSVIYQTINGIIAGNFNGNEFRAIIWGLSGCLTAIPVLVYHWRVLREDQHHGAERTRRRKRVNVIIGAAGDELVRRIEAGLGYRVRKLAYTGVTGASIPTITDVEIEKLVESVVEAEGDGIIIDLSEGTVRMLPFRDE